MWSPAFVRRARFTLVSLRILLLFGARAPVFQAGPAERSVISPVGRSSGPWSSIPELNTSPNWKGGAVEKFTHSTKRRSEFRCPGSRATICLAPELLAQGPPSRAAELKQEPMVRAPGDQERALRWGWELLGFVLVCSLAGEELRVLAGLP